MNVHDHEEVFFSGEDFLASEHAGSDLLRLIEAFGVDAAELTTAVNL